jgi:ABC-type transporter Mla maintaining outer membrane lipid asymmetry ATPase subunit MlaF
VGLDDSVYRKLPKELSGGINQRYAIAQAFTNRPGAHSEKRIVSLNGFLALMNLLILFSLSA